MQSADIRPKTTEPHENEHRVMESKTFHPREIDMQKQHICFLSNPSQIKINTIAGNKSTRSYRKHSFQLCYQITLPLGRVLSHTYTGTRQQRPVQAPSSVREEIESTFFTNSFLIFTRAHSQQKKIEKNAPPFYPDVQI